jgi:23S rRNA (guanosine2251-2'-O)-methyltransferase
MHKKSHLRKLKTDEMGRLGLSEYKQATKIKLHLVLDNLRSMHNVGSVFRTADAFLVEHIHLCERTPVPPHRAIQKTALGATESVDWSYHASSIDCVKKLKSDGFRVFALEQTEESYSLGQLSDFISKDEKIALVLGNEVSGVEQLVIDQCNGAIEIPQFGTKHSLNVAVSAGISIWSIFLVMADGIE